MSSFTHRSFLYGVILASVTWAASLYLYFSLTHPPSSDGTRMASTFPNDLDEDAYIPLRNRGIFNDNFKLPNLNPSKASFIISEANAIAQPKYESSWKTKFRKLVEQNEKVENSDRLVESLRGKTRLLNDGGAAISALDSVGLIKSLGDKKIREEGYRKHAFNALISERLGYHRPLPDTRHKLCSSISYPKAADLPSASVIICFYNEEYHALLRTIHSVLDPKRSDPLSLHEILLVDDSSDLDNLHVRLEEYVKHNFPPIVKLLKTPSRAGLIRARIFGARRASGDILVFLDSHVEPNINWLTPLLTRIHEDNHTVVTPIIDIVNADTMEYSASPLVKGGFNWGLHFRWDPVKKSDLQKPTDYVKPIVSPTMAGGLFAMDRKYFLYLGEYDDGMDIWGGENTEISFRIWMCGGRLEIIPCSRVGHVFRKRRPYGSPTGEDTTTKNSIRVAEVWMDEFKQKFYETHPEAKGVPYGDISQRSQLRSRLQCKSFNWYLHQVYPEVLREGKATIMSLDRGGVRSPRKRKYLEENFQLRLTGTKLCVESAKEVTQKNQGLMLVTCRPNKRQRWSESEKHELLLAELLCLDAGSELVKLRKCHEARGSQEWKWAGKKETPIFNLASGLCLGIEGSGSGKKELPELGSPLKLVICDETINENAWLKFDLINTDENQSL